MKILMFLVANTGCIILHCQHKLIDSVRVFSYGFYQESRFALTIESMRATRGTLFLWGRVQGASFFDLLSALDSSKQHEILNYQDPVPDYRLVILVYYSSGSSDTVGFGQSKFMTINSKGFRRNDKLLFLLTNYVPMAHASEMKSFLKSEGRRQKRNYE